MRTVSRSVDTGCSPVGSVDLCSAVVLLVAGFVHLAVADACLERHDELWVDDGLMRLIESAGTV